jgi:hypothetical protein
VATGQRVTGNYAVQHVLEALEGPQPTVILHQPTRGKPLLVEFASLAQATEFFLKEGDLTKGATHITNRAPDQIGLICYDATHSTMWEIRHGTDVADVRCPRVSPQQLKRELAPIVPEL